MGLCMYYHLLAFADEYAYVHNIPIELLITDFDLKRRYFVRGLYKIDVLFKQKCFLY